MTDRDGLYGAARFVAACQRNGREAHPRRLAHRAGAARRAAGTRRDAHVVLLAEDDTGYANLCRLLTDAHMLGERGDPWVAAEQICAHAAGMTRPAGPAVASGAARRRRPGRRRRARWPRRSARRSAPSGASSPSSIASRPAPATRSARCSGSPSGSTSRAVATNPVRYLVPDDAFLADALECMRAIVPVAANQRDAARTPRAG